VQLGRALSATGVLGIKAGYDGFRVSGTKDSGQLSLGIFEVDDRILLGGGSYSSALADMNPWGNVATALITNSNFRLTIIPEPSTLLLLTAGLIGISIARSRMTA
jgi:hypothetical protein